MYQSNCLQLELLIDFELLRPFFGALPSLGLPMILAQYDYFIYLYYYIIIHYLLICIKKANVQIQTRREEVISTLLHTHMYKFIV